MTNLRRASQQLFSRPHDERFDGFDALRQHCIEMKESSQLYWQLPTEITPCPLGTEFGLEIGGNGIHSLNDWSFGQMCSIAEVQKETVNRLSPDTASRVFRETLPLGGKPLQLLTQSNMLRSIHGASYTRLFDADLLEMVRSEADGFGSPPKGMNGATGFYAGQQDMFAFLIDDSAWVEIGGEQFAPGFFVWNSEVGRLTIGVETFWFQHVCANHIVWDAIEVVRYSRKHTANVVDAIDDIQSVIHRLVQSRNVRRDAFAKSMEKALSTRLGVDAEEATKSLNGRGISASLVKEAVNMMSANGGRFTLFNAVDTLTRLTGRLSHIGDRSEQDARIGALLSLAV